MTEKTIRDLIKADAPALRELALRIHRNPELGMEEKKACAWQVAMLKKWGFSVQSPFAGIGTAFKAVAGKGRPVFCLMSEYDALPEIGHACGHNLIATSALAAGHALAQLMRREKVPGTLVVMGTPAEEGGGGKVQMIEAAALKGVDAAMMAHPYSVTSADPGSSAVRRFLVSFQGLAAHAAASPEAGLNALDAVLLLFQAVNCWRQQLPEDCRIHGIIDNGGAAPNIIPDQASCYFYLRSLDNAYLDRMEQRFRDIVKGAGLMTATTPKISCKGFDYKARIPNPELNAAYAAAAAAAGMEVSNREKPGRASSDFGNVSVEVPAAHVYFSIAKTECQVHSLAFRRAAASAYGISQALRAAEAMTVCGWRYFTEKDFRARVQAGFQKQ